MLAEEIKNNAVKVVEAYINNKVPLSESISAIAKAGSLNPEQIKRLIEATNQIAYLKLQMITEDRTFEFPLADYEEVMAKVIELEPSMSKQASVNPELSPMSIVQGMKSLEKSASENVSSTPVDIIKRASKRDQVAWLTQSIHASRTQLEKIASDCDIMVLKLADAANRAKKEEYFLEKLAHVTNQDATFSALIKLAGEEQVELRESLFKDSDLESVNKLVSLHKEANDLLAYKNTFCDSLVSSADLLDELLGHEKGAAIAGLVTGPVASAIKGTVKTGKKLGGKVLAGGGLLAGVAGISERNAKPETKKVTNRLR